MKHISLFFSIMVLLTSCSLTPEDSSIPDESVDEMHNNTGFTQENELHTDEIEMASIDEYSENSTGFIETVEAKNIPLYRFPEESKPHEGTWLQWPHEHQYGKTFRDRLDPTWVSTTEALITSEQVHIIAYDEWEKSRIIKLLENANIPLTRIDFTIAETDDFWVRDNGPIFVRDRHDRLVIQDWGFNWWGEKAESNKCDIIPAKIAKNQKRKFVNLNHLMINEWGAVELDGRGTLLATRSAILNKNRNPGMTTKRANFIFHKYLGASNVIWLDGVPGLDITDMHIDGFARFANDHTIITMDHDDLIDWQVSESDITKLYGAKDVNGKWYKIVTLPLTENNITTTYGKILDYPWSYVNYYIANSVVLVPNYGDPNDQLANQIISDLYPDRKVIGIDARNLYANGGMIHCITQQQPKE
jgi:agmatine deiminase